MSTTYATERAAATGPRALLRRFADAAVSPLTVDDLLDHMLPANWRDRQNDRARGEA